MDKCAICEHTPEQNEISLETHHIIPQKELHVVQVPDYVTLTYDVFMITNFFEHMNHLVESFIYANNSYWGDGKYKFKVSYENISNSTEFSDLSICLLYIP